MIGACGRADLARAGNADPIADAEGRRRAEKRGPEPRHERAHDARIPGVYRRDEQGAVAVEGRRGCEAPRKRVGEGPPMRAGATRRRPRPRRRPASSSGTMEDCHAPAVRSASSPVASFRRRRTRLSRSNAGPRGA